MEAPSGSSLPWPAVISYETKTSLINLCQIWTIGVNIRGEEKEVIVRAFVGLPVPWETMLKNIYK